MTSTQQWFKSSYSGSSGGECIEVAFNWRKSSYSDSEGAQCVEVATTPHTIHLRDSKNPGGPTFAVAPTAWTKFLDWTA
ncbi:DUF397 domain-containing protein [Streptomyces liangshanensis]|uniref:DUF397 domain-containing protein n=1 Tax=Streptomyces liangshanensis TaxID=2717324 RepID=A0A6G9GZ42_9ACTN|nr:DUF397 domain-containing protein [Streptomyces liangshanensis]QIQ03553.1 DUF397 domain-containing protein [Streptomyces liangshanensis]